MEMCILLSNAEYSFQLNIQLGYFTLLFETKVE